MTPHANRNLVIACVGDESLHPRWIRGPREFDLFLVYYGDQAGKWKETADHYIAAKGAKYALIHNVATEHASTIAGYDRIWLPDDDILTDTQTINRLFRVFEEHGLELGQPALDDDSYINVEHTRQRRFMAIRFTRCIEIMVPLFTRRAFELCTWTFLESKSCWGVDWLWIRLVNEGRKDLDRVGIINEVAVTHTKKQDLKSGFYADLDTGPQAEFHALMERHGLTMDFTSYKVGIRVFGRVFCLSTFPDATRLPWVILHYALRPRKLASVVLHHVRERFASLTSS